MEKILFYNPFIYLAGTKSLWIGSLIILVLSFTCFLSGTHYFTLLNISYAKDMDLQYFLAEHFLYWIISSSLLLILGNLLSKSKPRIVDVFGTQAISKFPLIILPLVRFIPVFSSLSINSIYLEILFWVYLLLDGL